MNLSVITLEAVYKVAQEIFPRPFPGKNARAYFWQVAFKPRTDAQRRLNTLLQQEVKERIFSTIHAGLRSLGNCPNCDGIGHVPGGATCCVCKGSGQRPHDAISPAGCNL